MFIKYLFNCHFLIPQQFWQPSTSSIPSALLAHLLSFRFNISNQDKNAESWQLCLVLIHPHCPILVSTILTTFITFSTFQPWNDSHSRAVPAEQESSGNFQFSNWPESGDGYSYHTRLIHSKCKTLPKGTTNVGSALWQCFIFWIYCNPGKACVEQIKSNQKYNFQI